MFHREEKLATFTEDLALHFGTGIIIFTSVKPTRLETDPAELAAGNCMGQRHR